MNPRSLFTVCCLLLMAPPLIGLEVPYEKFELDNGLTVIFHEDHSLPVACVNIWYYVGAKDEAPGRSGFAHLFEHLMFMGTERVPGSDFDRIMEEEGGWNNATTSWDRTNYYSFGPARLLTTLLWLDADRMEDLGRVMTQEKLDKQREVVRNERRQTSEMRPYGKADLKISELMYPMDHPYHIEVIGTHEDLQAATLQDVKDFFDAYYVPNNASLVVAGDFDPAEIRPLVEEMFGTLPRGPESIHADAAPVELGGVRRAVFTDSVQFARLTMVYHSPARYRPGDAEMGLAADVLGTGKTSRLYKRLVYDEQLATDVSAYQSSAMLGSLLMVKITARQGVSLDKIEGAVDEVIGKFVEEGPSEEELKRHKADIEFRAIGSLQSLLGKADRLNRYNAYFGEPDSFERVLNLYRNATAADVREWSARVLDPGSRLIMRVYPENERDLRAPRDTRPNAGEEKPFSIDAPVSFTLSNGVRVMHWQRSVLPLVEVEMLLRGGAVWVDGNLPGLAQLSADMLDEGAGELDALAFADAMDLLGAEFTAYADRESSHAILSVLKRNLRPAVSLFADAIRRPRFDAVDWERVRTLHLQELRQRLDRPATVASQVGMRAFFGDGHPYGRPLGGWVEGVEQMTLADVRDAYQRQYSPSNAVILIAGDLSAEDARELLEEAFGNWEPAAGQQPLAEPAVHPPANQALRVVVVDKPDAVQTVIRFVMPGPTCSSPDRVMLRLINTILGGSFTSRLNQNLRERHGFTYGARSQFVMGPTSGYFTASSTVQAEVTGRALEQFIYEFNRIRAGSISATEVRKARETNRMDTIQSFQGLRGLIQTAAELEGNGLPFSTLEADLAAMVAADRQRLNGLAASAVPLEQALLVLVGNRDLILEQLEGLDLPAPDLLTAAGNRVEVETDDANE